MDVIANAPAGRKMRQIQFSMPERVYEELSADAQRLCITPGIMARLKMGDAYPDRADGDRREIRVPVNNYEEIARYVDDKQLGTVSTFAAFAMQQYMSRYPLKTAGKAAKGERPEDGAGRARAVQPDAPGGD